MPSANPCSNESLITVTTGYLMVSQKAAKLIARFNHYKLSVSEELLHLKMHVHAHYQRACIKGRVKACLSAIHSGVDSGARLPS